MSTKFKVRSHDPKPLLWWYKTRSRIDLEPSYQRKGRLWSLSDKGLLIDSILNGYDIPKLYLADFTWGESQLNESKLPYAVIDGKQRLEAIFEFFDGSLSLNKDIVISADPHLRLGALSYRDLKANYPDLTDELENYVLTVMSVYAREETPIQELFVRLNRSKPLTGAEIRNAMQGPVPTVIRNIARHAFFLENVRFSITRAQDQNTAAKLLIFEFSDKIQDTKKTVLDNFVAQHKTASRQLELAGRRVVEILDAMSGIFIPKDNLLSSSGTLPVYYWFIRRLKPSVYHHIREFLIFFEEERAKNRKRSKSGGQVNNIYVTYDNLNRSANDYTSHVGRVKILDEQFQKWLRRPNR